MHTAANFGRLLGELEHQIMRIVWSNGGAATCRTVIGAVRRTKPLAYTTVVTVMNRLVDKRLLQRRLADGAYVYTTPYTQEEFYTSLAGTMLSRIREQFGEVAIACFVEEAEKMNRKKLKKILNHLRSRNMPI